MTHLLCSVTFGEVKVRVLSMLMMCRIVLVCQAPKQIFTHAVDTTRGSVAQIIPDSQSADVMEVNKETEDSTVGSSL